MFVMIELSVCSKYNGLLNDAMCASQEIVYIILQLKARQTPAQVSLKCCQFS